MSGTPAPLPPFVPVIMDIRHELAEGRRILGQLVNDKGEVQATDDTFPAIAAEWNCWRQRAIDRHMNPAAGPLPFAFTRSAGLAAIRLNIGSDLAELVQVTINRGTDFGIRAESGLEQALRPLRPMAPSVIRWPDGSRDVVLRDGELIPTAAPIWVQPFTPVYGAGMYAHWFREALAKLDAELAGRGWHFTPVAKGKTDSQIQLKPPATPPTPLTTLTTYGDPDSDGVFGLLVRGAPAGMARGEAAVWRFIKAALPAEHNREVSAYDIRHQLGALGFNEGWVKDKASKASKAIQSAGSTFELRTFTKDATEKLKWVDAAHGIPTQETKRIPEAETNVY